jgi:hypothetical protein
LRSRIRFMVKKKPNSQESGLNKQNSKLHN